MNFKQNPANRRRFDREFHRPSEGSASPIMVRLAEVAPEPIRWLWPGRMAMGRLTLLVGRPGAGKSLVALDIAARISTGAAFGDGAAAPRGSVVLINGEDSANDVLRPRLEAHGADLMRIHLLHGIRQVSAENRTIDRMFTLRDLAAVEGTLRGMAECKLLVLDPLGSFYGRNINPHDESQVRSVLTPLASMAERLDVAVLLVMHRRKAGGKYADDLALGSRALTGMARSVWHLERDPEDSARRLLLPGKNNLAAEGSGLAFRVDGPRAKITWEPEAVRMSVDEVIGGRRSLGRPPADVSVARDWLAERLASGAKYVGEPGTEGEGTIRSEVKAAGLSWPVRRAAGLLKVMSRPCSQTGKYQWSLPSFVPSPGTPGEG